MDLQTKTAAPLVLLDPTTGEIVPPSADRAEVRAWILALAKAMKGLPTENQLNLPVKHTFLDGMYMRELFIPKGTLLIGKIHKMPCMNIVSRGDISVLTETGSARVKAGYTVVTPAGIQKLGYAHEDTVFINIFRTDETDPALVEDAVAFEELDVSLLDCEETKCLLPQ